MTEEENKSVDQQVDQAVAQAAEPEVNVQESERQKSPEKKPRDDQAYNWAEANRKMKELDQQNREMREQLHSMQKQKEVPAEIDELDKLGDDDIMTKSQAKKLAEKIARHAASEAIKQERASTVEDRLSLKHPDWSDVVSKENIELLKQTEPELALSLSHNPDPYAQGIAAYKLLKRLGIGTEPQKFPEKERAQANAQKPVSVNAVSKNSAIGSVHMFENGLTKELKASLWKEIQECKKRTG